VQRRSVSDETPYEDAAMSLSDFVRTFAEVHRDPNKRHLSDFEYGMLKQVADTLQIDQEVRQREAERVSSAEDRMSAAKAGWELVPDDD
jgi:hypothetical protein